MREILFRGKRIGNGEWVEGFLLKECNYATCSWNLAIEHKTDRFGKFSYDVAEVVAETIGQFTGLTDKNGKKIFDGDIVQYSDPDEDIIHGTVAYGNHSCCGTHEVGFFVEWQKPELAMYLREDIGFWTNFREIEVIGNIHDNPELLGGENDGK
jgi:uncharacterized phage protein (TIGR01671 family)